MVSVHSGLHLSLCPINSLDAPASPLRSSPSTKKEGQTEKMASEVGKIGSPLTIGRVVLKRMPS